MILSDIDIKQAIKEQKLIIDPEPEDRQIDSTTIDLRVGEPFYIWDPQLVNQHGINISIDLDNFNYKNLAEPYQKEVAKDTKGRYVIEPEKFYLAPTFEKVHLPENSQLAARVEGKSSLARLGLVIHMTAPTIHCGYGPGIITLEIYNYGPFSLCVTPGKTFLCQLIIESVKSIPTERNQRKFTQQKSPKG